MIFTNFIVYQNKNLGDVLLTTPLLRVLLDHLESKGRKGTLHLISKKQSHALLASMDKRIEFHVKPQSFRAWVTLLAKLPKGGSSLMLIAHVSGVALFIAKILGLKSVCSEPLSKLGFRVDYAVPFRYTPWRHISEQHLDLWRRVGGVVAAEQQRLFAPDFPETESNWEINFTNYIVIHPGSRWMFKTPSRNFWGDLTSRLSGFDGDIVVTGSADRDERELCELVANTVGGVSLAGKTTIVQLAQLIQYAKGYLGVDTFASHLAAAYRTPGLVLFGPTSPEIWGPYGSNQVLQVFRALQGFPCMPCHADGCGGSKRSDCLDKLGAEAAFLAFCKAVSMEALHEPKASRVSQT